MIKDIIDNIGLAVAAETGGKALPNPSSLTSNPITKLSNGYAVVFGGAENIEYSAKYSNTVNRQIDIILTKTFKSTDLSAESRLSAESSFIDTMRGVIKAVRQDPTLNKDNDVVDLYYTNDSGIELLEAEKMLVLVTTISLRLIYNEIY